MSVTQGTECLYSPSQHSAQNGRQFRAYSAQPQETPFGTGGSFGGLPFPAPAIAKPESTDAHRNLSHGYVMDFSANTAFCQPFSFSPGGRISINHPERGNIGEVGIKIPFFVLSFSRKGRDKMKRIKLRDRKLPDYTKGEEIMNMVLEDKENYPKPIFTTMSR